jgi:predicted  nucleic acid-binding Zn-ribbon protein
MTAKELKNKINDNERMISFLIERILALLEEPQLNRDSIPAMKKGIAFARKKLKPLRKELRKQEKIELKAAELKKTLDQKLNTFYY